MENCENCKDLKCNNGETCKKTTEETKEETMHCYTCKQDRPLSDFTAFRFTFQCDICSLTDNGLA